MFKHKKKQSSFFKKIFTSFLAITIVITILLTSFLTLNYLKTTVNMAYDFNKNLLAQSNYSITYINELAKSLSDSLYNNNDIISFLYSNQKDNAVTVRAFHALKNVIFPLNYVESVYIYNSQINMLISSKYGEQTSVAGFFDEDIAKMLSSKEGDFSRLATPFPHRINTPNGAKTICSYSQFETDKDKKSITNALIVNIDTKTLTNSMKAINSYNSEIPTQFAVIDKDGFVLDTNFSGNETVRKKLVEEINLILTLSSSSGNKSITADRTDYLLSYSNQNQNKWYIFGIIPRKSLLSDITYASMVGLISVILLFLLCGGVCFYLAKQLNNPIRQITNIVQGKNIDKTAISSIKTNEFQILNTVFQTMKEQNDHLKEISGGTEYSIKQDFLNNLVSGTLIHSPEKIKSRLEPFNLSFLAKNRLCMCVLKIDSYSKFFSENNQRERWALLYAVVNISSEISEKYFTGEVFSTNSDKFIVLLKCEDDTDFITFKAELNHMLHELSGCISSCLGISLSMTYSTIFKGLEHIPGIYKNLEELIQMKLKYGHGCIISPDMHDEMASEYFQIPLNMEDQLVQKVNSSEKDAATDIYNQISSQLFEYSYDEIMSYIIHLAYTIHASVQIKNPCIKQDVTSILKSFMANLHSCEVADDINSLIYEFIGSMCNKIDSGKSAFELQNNEIIASKMCEIIERECGNSNLCLSFIADEIGMSPNYIGHIFKSVQNISVPKYISELKMKKVAYYLVNTKLSLDEIAKLVGMEKNNYFYTCFKKYTGMSLSEYKLKMLK